MGVPEVIIIGHAVHAAEGGVDAAKRVRHPIHRANELCDCFHLLLPAFDSAQGLRFTSNTGAKAPGERHRCIVACLFLFSIFLI
jgi:hypothetical protein